MTEVYEVFVLLLLQFVPGNNTFGQKHCLRFQFTFLLWNSVAQWNTVNIGCTICFFWIEKENFLKDRDGKYNEGADKLSSKT